MAAKNVLGIIFSNAYDEALPELTALRTMGSIPFAGRYRLIDFPLSNMVNAGIQKVGVITKSNYRSLMDHIGNGKAWDLSRKREGMTLLPPYNSTETGAFKDKVDSLYGSIDYLRHADKDLVLCTDCNVVSTIDYDAIIKAHTANNADVTLAYTNGIPPQMRAATELVMDAQGKVTACRSIDCYSSAISYSLKIMVISRTLLERLLHEAHGTGQTSFEQIIASNLQFLNVYGYEVGGFVRVLSSLGSYYEANLALLDRANRNLLFDPERPVFTKVRDEVPAVYGLNARVSNSLIADGCKIEGEVENSILFRGVTVAKGAKIKDSILMQNTYIGENVSLTSVILDKSVVVKPNKMLCGAQNYPVYVGKGIVI
ncbi:MAG: glucose-1-phosphate adenylyltransferase subunit GlgD [Clostridia bacterium]|nr:glucose-1-phosphate adenylyltransferase subunit GlgD [Clostridia bacterium]